MDRSTEKRPLVGAVGTPVKQLDVLFDGRPLYDEQSRDRGIGVFARSLLTSVASRPGVVVSALVTTKVELPPGIRTAPIRRSSFHRFEVIEHRIRLGLEIMRERPDVFHSPALEPPMFCAKPWVQTIHDVTPLDYDHPYFLRERRHWQQIFARMRHATLIVAVSRYSADAAIRLLGLDPGRVRVVPNGVDPMFRIPTERPRVDPPHLLYVGVFGPHKGYLEAFQVVSELARRGYPHKLKLVGSLNPWRRREIDLLLKRCSHPERVDLLGFVTKDELHKLYRSASGLIATSRCEGFGLPALEAMASGTPVVSFDNTALTEVVADGGVLVPDGDVPAMVDALNALLDDGSRWTAASDRGVAHARLFDWATVARRYADIYAEAAR